MSDVMTPEQAKCKHAWAVLIACDKVQVGPATHLRWCHKCGLDQPVKAP